MRDYRNVLFTLCSSFLKVSVINKIKVLIVWYRHKSSDRDLTGANRTYYFYVSLLYLCNTVMWIIIVNLYVYNVVEFAGDGRAKMTEV